MTATLRRVARVSITALTFVLGAMATVSVPSSQAAPPIVNGTRANINDYKWTVKIENAAGGDVCGGTLVAANKVVTAAHCTEFRTASSLRVVWGREDKNSSAGVVARVVRFWQHPSFRRVETGDDVSVLTLDRNLAGPYLPLATTADAALYNAGTQTTVLGWGRIRSGGPASRYLLKATVPVVSDAECAAKYSPDEVLVQEDSVCAGYPNGGTDTCQGDSGGPMVAGGKLIGVTSWGYFCADARYPGVYAQVSHFNALITAQL
ncbi:S1 family peptidase [Lentzea sp. JNUCC 0626]|uniref:S1 family peptidase n=1 Tax=Lentzea sp. JNUCC 0626 TaxID=3367513 RepID=UPI0037486227